MASKFHNIIHRIDRLDGKSLTIDEKSSGLYIFRFTRRKGNRESLIASCVVSEHEDLGLCECYVENLWNSEGFGEAAGAWAVLNGNVLTITGNAIIGSVS